MQASSFRLAAGLGIGSLLVAGSAVVASPASAYVGPESAVRSALLPAATMFSIGGWNTTARPMPTTVTRVEPYDYAVVIPPTPAMTDTDVVPEFSQLHVLEQDGD